MRRYVSLFLSLCLVLTSFQVQSNAEIVRTRTVTLEQTLPFSVTNSTAAASVDVSTAGCSNVQVIDKYVDNGTITGTTVDSSSVTVNLNNGTYSSQPRTVIKTDTLTINDKKEDDTVNHIINATAKGPVNSILGCTGDFLSATYSNTQLYIKVNTALGKQGLDNTQLVTETLTFSSPNDNRNKSYTAAAQSLPYGIVGSPRTKSKTNGSVSYNYTQSSISAVFNNGNPTLNNSSEPYGYPYQWIDRHRDGHFSEFYPNSIYQAPNWPFSGQGKYITPTDSPGLAKTFTRNAAWTDYWGFGIDKNGNNIYDDSEKYYYPNNLAGNDYTKIFNRVDFPSAKFYNTEKLIVTMDSSEITFKPEGKLFSANEEKPADAWEIQDAFFSTRLQNPETYVRHFKFYYGPVRYIFGGYYTYSYFCQTEYDHYKPIKLYSGTVTYNYETIENSAGYTYNGWIKISYTEQKTITDYPPSRPGGIIASSTKIIHGPATDDYTPQNQLRYKYYYYKNGVWNYLGMTVNGTTQYSWNPAALGLNPNNLKVGVRANDLYQDGPMGENDPAAHLDLTGSIDKSVVPAGDTINITAVTDSYPDCTSVQYNVQNIISGNLTYQSKNPVETVMYHIKGSYTQYASDLSSGTNTKYQTYGIAKHEDNMEYTIRKNGVGQQTSQYNMTPTFQYLTSDTLNLDQKYTCGKTGTIILPALWDYSKTMSGFIGIGCTGSLNNTSLNSGTELGFFSVSEVSSNGIISYSDNLSANPRFSSSKAFMTGKHKEFVQIFDKRIFVPYYNKPVGITYIANNVKVYQDGTLVGTAQLSSSMEGRVLEGTNYQNWFKSSSDPRENYDFRPTGKHLFSRTEWSMDQITNFINGPYQDTYWDSPSGIRNNIPSYQAWLPGKITWTGAMTVPVTMKNGTYNLTLTANNGMQKSIDIPFVVSTPINPKGVMPAKVSPGKTYTVTATSSKYVNSMKLIVFGNTYTMVYDGLNGTGDKKWKYVLTVPGDAQYGLYNQSSGAFRYAEFMATLPSGEWASDYEIFEVVMPATVLGGDIYTAPGETVQVSAATTGYCTNASVDMPTGTVALANDKPVNNYDNIWRGSYTVPASQATGTYNITYKGTNSYMTAAQPARLIVDVFLTPVGDVPDSIETKTNFKIKCTTTLNATSVIATLDPTPGAAQYTLNLVSQDSSKKYWGSADLQYPEGAAGGPAGKIVTGTFTARAANGKTEVDTDTGHLWEKIEVTGYELRRSLYQDNDISKPVVESLCRSQDTRFSDSAGFIMAGQVMGIKVMTKGYVDRIEMDFDGPVVDYTKDNSVKILDKLTQKFEWDDVVNRGRTPEYASLDALKNYYSFPKNFTKAAKAATSPDNIYTTYYLIPYGTKQSLHSWYTLREESGSAFNIDKSKLLKRIKEPFILKLKIYSGSRYIEKDIKFDVFEKWDTLLNRDIRPYIDNPGDHDPVSQSTWETTDYIEEYFKNR